MRQLGRGALRVCLHLAKCKYQQFAGGSRNSHLSCHHGRMSANSHFNQPPMLGEKRMESIVRYFALVMGNVLFSIRERAYRVRDCIVKTTVEGAKLGCRDFQVKLNCEACNGLTYVPIFAHHLLDVIALQEQVRSVYGSVVANRRGWRRRIGIVQAALANRFLVPQRFYKLAEK